MNFKLLIKVVQWILLTFKLEGSLPVSSLVKLIERQEVIAKSRGTKGLIDFNKSVRSNLLAYISGSKLRDSRTACNKDGIPRALGSLAPLIKNNSYLAITMSLTILMSTRSLRLKPEPNLDSISAPFNGDLKNYSMFVSDFWRALGYRPQVSSEKLWAKLEQYRTKSGPNGHALSTSALDAQALPSTLFDQLKRVGGPDLAVSMRLMRNQNFLYYYYSRFMQVIGNSSFRRLSAFPDKEGKTRVIGILDWWSQAALKPLHNYLANALRKIPQDCTLDQSNFKKCLKGSKEYYSVDLSSATDRFPIELISRLLKAQLAHPYVDAWKSIMVDYPFDFEGEKISYSTGNPMGAYSSFNSFALTHHYLIFYCCKVLGIEWRTLPYALLGDDIVIGNKDVGDLYMKVIRDLGLEYSPLKTHKSERFYEFAKRYFLDGVEITPFPFSALKECHKSVVQLTTLLFELKSKNFVPNMSIAKSTTLYHSLVKELPSRFRKKLEKKSSLCEGVLLTIHGHIPVDEWINSLIKQNGYHLPTLSPDVCKNILSNVVVQAFADSNLMKSVNVFTHQFPLARVSGNAQLDFMDWLKGCSSEFKSQLNSTHWKYTPLYNAHRAVKEEYDRLLNEVEMRDRLGEDWAYKMRTFALPATDKSVLANQRFELSKVSKLFGTLVEEQLQILQLYPQLIPV